MTLRLRPAERGDHADRYKGMGGAVKSGASIRDYFRGLLQPDSSGEGSLMYRFVTCLIACSIAWLAVFPARAVEVTSYKLDKRIGCGRDRGSPRAGRGAYGLVPCRCRGRAARQVGIAHFVEHLMFRGTDDLEPGEFSEIVAENVVRITRHVLGLHWIFPARRRRPTGSDDAHRGGSDARHIVYRARD